MREAWIWEQRGNRLEDASEPSVIPLGERESHVRLGAEGSTSSFIFDCSVSLAAAFRIDHRITETNLMLLKKVEQSRYHGQNGGGGEKGLDAGGSALRIWEWAGHGLREECCSSQMALMGLFELLVLHFELGQMTGDTQAVLLCTGKVPFLAAECGNIRGGKCASS